MTKEDALLIHDLVAKLIIIENAIAKLDEETGCFIFDTKPGEPRPVDVVFDSYMNGVIIKSIVDERIRILKEIENF